MFKWKDFFYFSKGDKIGIILLLILIAVSGIFYVALHKFVPPDDSYIVETEQIEKDFVQFEQQLEVIPAITDDENEEDAAPIKTKTPRAKLTKLQDGQTLDINAVSAKTLTRIPGIGDTFAERIIEYRNALGGFVHLEQLREIKGITMNKYSQILPYIVLKKKHKMFNINASELSHPYLNEEQVKAIKTIHSLDELTNNEHFTIKDVERLRPYLDLK